MGKVAHLSRRRNFFLFFTANSSAVLGCWRYTDLIPRRRGKITKEALSAVAFVAACADAALKLKSTLKGDACARTIKGAFAGVVAKLGAVAVGDLGFAREAGEAVGV